MRQLVGDYRLFTYQEIGFKDEHPEQRVIGKVRPEVILLAEKDSLGATALRLAEEFAITCQVVRGMPTLLDTEYLARALGEAGQRAVQVIAYVDYDPGGWGIADGLVGQLTAFGLPRVEPAKFMVRAEDFTAEEVELFALPCKMGTPSLATKARQWVKRSGGIGGELLTMHANHLQPYERVRECLARVLG